MSLRPVQQKNLSFGTNLHRLIVNCYFFDPNRFERGDFKIMGVAADRTDYGLRLLKAIEHAGDTRRYPKCEPAPCVKSLRSCSFCGMRPSEVVTMREQVNIVGAVYLNPKKTKYTPPSHTAK